MKEKQKIMTLRAELLGSIETKINDAKEVISRAQKTKTLLSKINTQGKLVIELMTGQGFEGYKEKMVSGISLQKSEIEKFEGYKKRLTGDLELLDFVATFVKEVM